MAYSLRLTAHSFNKACLTPALQKPEGKQHGIDTILRIHLGESPGHGVIATILYIVTTHYIYFAMLLMQLWGKE